MNILYYCFKNLAKGFFHIFYRHRVYGLEHFIPGGAIIAPNHLSYLDPPLIGVSWPEEISFLARKSLFKKKVFGALIAKLNAYPVTGTQQDLASIKVICKLLSNHKKVVIFPEGIRSTHGNLMDIKSGIGMLAQRNHCPIIPAYIQGSYEIWNRHRRFPKLCGKTVCVFGSPIPYERFSHLGKKEAQDAIARAVKESIEALKQWYQSGAIGIPP